MAKRILSLFGIFLIAGAGIGPGDLSSCGPFLPQTVFTGKTQPLNEPAFFRGRLGILQPRYERLYLMAAYRYLAGVGLTREDQEALMLKPSGPDYLWTDTVSPAEQGWLQVRIQVGAPSFAPNDPNPINRLKILPGYVSIVNCGDDAFRNATATLTGHARGGASPDDLRAWVAAQDLVFENCSDPRQWEPHPRPPGPRIPEALPANAAAWMRADRVYQIAAAEFYAGQFDTAAADFQRIAGDPASPWHAIATYLAARALVRKVTVDEASGAAPAAQEQLRKVLADPDAAAWHASARGLQRFLRARTDPERVTSELAHIVATQKAGVAGTMHDYQLMLGRFMDKGKQPPRDEDLTNWIAAMQYTGDDSALAKWRETRSIPWLVAALTYADQPDRDLMAAAAQVPESSPAFPTVEFHRLRLMPADDARNGLDAALSRKMPADERNLFLAARMRLARNWDELLRDAPRTVGATYTEGWHAEYEPVMDPELYFDDDAARILDRQIPLATLRLAARSPRLPANLQLQVARAAWVRAILLADAATAAEIADSMAARDPRVKAYVDGYQAARDEKTRTFAAAWLMLNTPGMRLAIDAGAGRLTGAAKLDPFRDNWWCPPGAIPNNGRGLPAGPRLNAPLELLYQGKPPAAAFLTDAQRAAAGEEQKRLAQSPAAPTWLARTTVEWVEAHPGDPRDPDALQLAVRAGHYACGGDAETNRWVQRAFDLLHSAYPRSPAARRTPYWFDVDKR